MDKTEKITKCPVCGNENPVVRKSRGNNGFYVACGYPCYFATLTKPTEDDARQEWERICGMWGDTRKAQKHAQDHLREAAMLLSDIRAHIIKAGQFASSAGNMESRGNLRFLFKELQIFEKRILREVETLAK